MPIEVIMKDLAEVGPALRRLMVVTENPYPNGPDAGQLMIYRMRLFTPSERQVLRNGLRKSSWECIQGGAGMMDELEMVNFESNGKKITDLRNNLR